MNLQMNRTKVAVSALAFTAAASIVTTALLFPGMIRANDDDEVTHFTVDVTQDARTNAQNNLDPSKGQDTLSRGDTFIVDGAVYPARTLADGVSDPGPTAHPIGNYRIRGTTLLKSASDFARAVAGDTTAPRLMFFATEEFSFPDDETSILTEGVWPNAHRSAYRVVIGGTGRFRNVVGEAFIENIGEGTNGFCNSRVTFKLKRIGVRQDH
jgi:hypothetical protein